MPKLSFWPPWILSSGWAHTSLNTCYFLVICLCWLFLPQVSVFVLFCLYFTCLKRSLSSSNLNFLFSIQVTLWFVSQCQRIKPRLAGRNSSWWPTTLLGFFISLAYYIYDRLTWFASVSSSWEVGHQSQESPWVVCNQEKPGPQPFANLFFHWSLFWHSLKKHWAFYCRSLLIDVWKMAGEVYRVLRVCCVCSVCSGARMNCLC